MLNSLDAGYVISITSAGTAVDRSARGAVHAILCPKTRTPDNRDRRTEPPERQCLLNTTSAILEFDTWIDNEIDSVLESIERSATPISANDLSIYDVMRYHLGISNASFERERSDPGKRLRSKFCLLCCEVADADPWKAVPAAASIELLHNFTLIHDDIQDRSPLRRHRPTVWSVWDVPQAINAGDGMFAAAHVALNRSTERGVSAEVTLDLSTELHFTTLRIVEGQVLDLGFERRDNVTAGEYLEMIKGKTSAIIEFACWAGGRIGDVPQDRLPAFREFGTAIGMGFQMRDDYLGAWGAEQVTGKPFADDIRRRKQALPAILLRERAGSSQRRMIDALYAQDELDADAIETILDLMNRYEVSDSVQQEVLRWHDRARDLLDELGPGGTSVDVIADLVDSLVTRET